MAVYDGQLSWQVTGTFVQYAVVTIAAAVFPSFAGTQEPFWIALVGLLVSIGGLIMTLMFGSMVMRVRTYEEYWSTRAKQLEGILDDAVKTFAGSVELSKNGSIRIGEDVIKMGKISLIKSKVILGALFISFALVFLSLSAFNGSRLHDVVTATSSGANKGQTETSPSAASVQQSGDVASKPSNAPSAPATQAPSTTQSDSQPSSGPVQQDTKSQKEIISE
ncbi:MAG: hypothetical protein RH946_09460 [Rhodospirillales bacterium]